MAKPVMMDGFEIATLVCAYYPTPTTSIRNAQGTKTETIVHLQTILRHMIHFTNSFSASTGSLDGRVLLVCKFPTCTLGVAEEG